MPDDDRISIQELRADIHTIDSGGLAHGKTLIDPDDLLTLLDLAEAARQIVYPGGHLDDSWLGSTLKRSVDRFTFDQA